MKLLIVLLVGSGLIHISLCAVDRPRGVAISKASLYSAGKDFQCLDGSKKVPFIQINDDYCDCPDGSDEPGTSACTNGRFHCTNAGHKPMYIPSSRVNDAICDCCDGTDEYAGIVQCTNNCREMGRAAREEAERQHELMKEGFEIYQDYTKQGYAAKDEKENRLKELQAQKDEMQAKRDELEQAKLDAEAPEKVAKDAHKNSWEEQKKQREAENDREGAARAFDDLDTDNDQRITVREMQAHSEFDIDSNNEVTVDEAKPKPQISGQGRQKSRARNIKASLGAKPIVVNETAANITRVLEYLEDKEEVDFETFFTEIWQNIKEIYKPTEVDHIPRDAGDQDSGIPSTEEPPFEDAGDDPDPDEYYHGDDEDPYDDEDFEDEYDDDEDDYIEGDDEHEGGDAVSDQMPDYDDATKLLIEAAEKARAAFDEVDQQFRDSDKEITDINKFLSLDLGEEKEFFPLKDNCYEYTDREYTYKLCAFEKASQRSKSGGAETSLGKWGYWGGPEDNVYSVMVYENGQGCWNGPNRSVKVHIKCGKTNAVISASEPNRCEYEFQFTSPAACSGYQPSQQHDPDHDEL